VPKPNSSDRTPTDKGRKPEGRSNGEKGQQTAEEVLVRMIVLHGRLAIRLVADAIMV
jgi:hypothetical protein